MRKIKLLIVTSILLLLLPIIPLVKADTDYLVPATELHWNINPVPIHIIGSSRDRNITLQAMKTWNEAQAWFNNAYFPNDPAPDSRLR